MSSLGDWKKRRADDKGGSLRKSKPVCSPALKCFTSSDVACFADGVEVGARRFGHLLRVAGADGFCVNEV